MSRRAVLQILLVIAGEGVKRGRLAGQQTARGLGLGGLGRREVDAVQSQLGFELLNLGRLLDLDIAGCVGGATAAVIDGALHGVMAGQEAVPPFPSSTFTLTV